MLQKFSGASVRRVIDRSNSCVPEHAHDWPVLSLFVIGSYCNETELGRADIAGPSAIFYRAGAAHRNVIGPTGFEQVEIEFDPDWLGRTLMPIASVSRWFGGCAAAETRTLARLCVLESDQDRVRAAVRQFVQRAGRQAQLRAPGWLPAIASRLGDDTSVGVKALAREVNRHPSWVGSAYRRATGEGLLDTVARLRIECAARLLRETDQTCAAVAQEAGFCDQSHMNRTFRRVLGRLPSEVRNDRDGFRDWPATDTRRK